MDMAKAWVEAEFESIFREHYVRLVRVARRVLRCDAEAEEVCAEAFLRLYRSGPGVASDGRVGGWLYRTAIRAAIDVLRKNQSRGLEEEFVADESGQSENQPDAPLAHLLRRERVAEIRSVLTRLKPEKVQMLLLRHSGLSYKEIAETMQINVASVGTRLARAEAEFSTLYQRCQQRRGSAPRLQTAKEGQ